MSGKRVHPRYRLQRPPSRRWTLRSRVVIAFAYNFTLPLAIVLLLFLYRFFHSLFFSSLPFPFFTAFPHSVFPSCHGGLVPGQVFLPPPLPLQLLEEGANQRREHKLRRVNLIKVSLKIDEKKTVTNYFLRCHWCLFVRCVWTDMYGYGYCVK